MNPKLRSVLARVALVGGVAAVAALVARDAPHDQSIAIRLGSRQVTRVEGVITRQGDSEPTVGFSQDFPETSPRTVRHTFSAPNGTYIVGITLRHQREPQQVGAGAPTNNGTAAAAPTNNQERQTPPKGGVWALPPNQPETSFERRVSLSGGEVTLSPD